MKKAKLFRCVCLGFLTALALFGAGCQRKKPAESKPFEGQWVDVNGKTTLEIRGNTLTVIYGSHTEEYRLQVKKTEYMTALSPAEPDRDFGTMSELELRDDGSLWAYEMVMDAEGHTYHFVRPEALAAEKEIRDLSKDAPKVISSTELTSFFLSFKNSRGSYGLDDRWPVGSYSWELEKQEDGSYQMEFRVMGDSYVALDFSEEVTAEYAAGLAQLLGDLGIPAYNGYYMTNSVSKPGYSLYADYASGEELSVCAFGDAGDTCVFDLPALLDYAASQPLFSNEY